MTELAAALAKLAAAVPANVRAVCATLTDAGHEAVTVGGAVRDALLGRDPGDWDVASSARPEQVLAMFPRCIPTGLQHGTVTIVTGRGEASHVEVTTFRGEGAYSDGRRPDEVHFGVPLVDDLARRDLVVNAMAYDPARGVLHDPFGGLADLAARRLRAVGSSPDDYTNAVGRFTEDGLRVMRAVRFAAVLEFDLDAETERGIGQPSVLASLAKVSRERVSDELRKLLAAPRPSRGLVIAARAGIVASILPAVAPHIGDGVAWASAVDAASPEARLALVIVPLEPPSQRAAEQILRALKFSVADATSASKLVAFARGTPVTADDPALRRALRDLGRPLGDAGVSLLRALGAPAFADRAAAILARGDALSPAELAIAGKDLIAALALPPGPRIGVLLKALFDRVLDDPALNTRDQLLALARALP